MGVDRSLILNKIKNHLGMKKDAEFARFLGISPQTLSSWHQRNAYDLELLYSKCSDLSAGWLITGCGNMLKDTAKTNQSIIGNKIGGDQINSIDNRQYYSDSPDVLRAQIDERDRLINEKEKIIFEKDERIREKDEYIKELKEELKEYKGKNKA
jgi:transcriptional regulator with XRE-family HTH domain